MPINLAGGYAAGGMNDAILDLVKQRLLEQELAQRQEEAAFQRTRAQKQDERADRQETRQEALDRYARERDVAGDMRLAAQDARQADLDKVNLGVTQAKMLEGGKFNDLVDPSTQGFQPNAVPAIGLPPLPGTRVMGVSPPEVRQGKIQGIDIGGKLVRPRAAEDIRAEETRTLDEASRRRIAEQGPDDARANAQFAEQQRHNRAIEAAGNRAGDDLTANQRIMNAARLATQYDTARRPQVEMARQLNIMQEGLRQAQAGNTSAGSQAVLVTFQKILDPTSVVRESEYLRSAAGQSLLNQMSGAVERLKQGGAGVPLSELQKYVGLAEQIANQENQYISGVRKRVEATAKEFGLKPEMIFSDFGDNAPPGGVTGGGALPPLSQRVVGKTEAVIGGKPMVWGAGGWVPK